MSTRKRATFTVACLLALGAVGAPAYALHNDDPVSHPPVSDAPPTPDAEGFTPAMPQEPFTFEGCGTQVTVSEEVNEVRERVTETDVAVIVEAEGRLIVRADTADGRTARIDASGPATFFIVNDEDAGTSTFTGQFRGNTLILPFEDNAAQEAALEEAGIPQFALTVGTLLVQDVSEFTPEVDAPPKVISSEVLRVPNTVIDACTLLKAQTAPTATPTATVSPTASPSATMSPTPTMTPAS